MGARNEITLLLNPPLQPHCRITRPRDTPTTKPNFGRKDSMDIQSNAPWGVGGDGSPPLGDSTNTHIDQKWIKQTETPDPTRSFALSLAHPLQLRLQSPLSGSDLTDSCGALGMLARESPAAIGPSLSATLGFSDALALPASTLSLPASGSLRQPGWVSEGQAVRAGHPFSDGLPLESIARIGTSVAPFDMIPVQGMVPTQPLSMASLIAQIPVVPNQEGLADSLLGYGAYQAPFNLATRQRAGLNAAGGSDDGPNGPRRFGDGIDDSIQSLISVQHISADCTVVFVTLLVSGFIIGPKGASIREIQKCTGAHIRSYNKDMSPNQPRLVRAFTVQGSTVGQTLALGIFKAAIDRYKYLAEGACCGLRVSHVQNINGIDFFYSPPPKNIVPHAAGLHPLDDSQRNLCMRANKSRKSQEAADRLEAILNAHFK